MSDRKALRPCVMLRGGPRHGATLAEVELTTDNLAGYRRTGQHEPYVVTGPRGGTTEHHLRVWRYVDTVSTSLGG